MPLRDGGTPPPHRDGETPSLHHLRNHGVGHVAGAHLEAGDALCDVGGAFRRLGDAPRPDADAFRGGILMLFRRDSFKLVIVEADDFIAVGGG